MVNEEEVLLAEIARYHEQINNSLETIHERDWAIESQRRVISYQEAQLRRLRETLQQLKNCVAEVTDHISSHFVEISKPAQNDKQNSFIPSNIDELLKSLDLDSNSNTDEESPQPPSPKSSRVKFPPTRSKARRSKDLKSKFDRLNLGKKGRFKHNDAGKKQTVDTEEKSPNQEEARVDKKESPAAVFQVSDLHIANAHARDAQPILEAVLACRFSQKENIEFFKQLLGGTARELIQAHSTSMLVIALSGFLLANSIRYHHDLKNHVPEWLSILVETTESAGAAVYVYDDDLGELYLRCTTGQFAHPTRVKKGTGLIGNVFVTRKSSIVNDNFSNARDSAHVRNQMVCPMRLSLSVVGVVSLHNKRSLGGYTAADAKFVEAFAAHASPGLSASKSDEQTKMTSEREVRILKQAITGDKGRFMSPLVREIMRGVSVILEAERCTLFLADDTNNRLWAIVNQVGENIIIEIPNDRGIAGIVYQQGKLLNIGDCYSDARFNHAVDRESGFKTRTILASPIPCAVTGKPIGVIQAINRIGGHFTRSDEQRMSQLCSMVSRILNTSETLEDLTVTAEMQERIFQKVSLPVITLNATGHCTKVSADAAELFGVNHSFHWVGKQIAEVFASSNPEIFELWITVMDSEKESQRNVLLNVPGKTERSLPHAIRMFPLKYEGNMFGIAVVFARCDEHRSYHHRKSNKTDND